MKLLLVAGTLPALGTLQLLLLVQEEVLDLVGHIQEVLLGKFAARQALTGLQTATQRK